MLLRELKIVAAALLYFTRLPIPFKILYNKEHQNLILTWLPLVGIVIGSLGALLFYCAFSLFPQNIAIVLAIACMVLLTGAFHEDGFADVCDAFGGGYTREQRLIIMKDSRVGSYAAIGLILLFAGKLSILTELNPRFIGVVLIASQTISRWPLLLVTRIWKYARSESNSKSIDASKPISVFRILLAFLNTVIPFFFFQSCMIFLAFPILIAFTLVAGLWFNKRIGGYTGDCLGAIQQINEFVFLLFCLGLFHSGNLNI
jgi:adenosylcobinamide-GDP ribazoletransferase